MAESEKLTKEARHFEHLRKKYLCSGAGAMIDSELIETALGFRDPDTDHSAAARELIDRFGSLERTLTAAASDTADIAGMDDRSAEYLCFLGDLFRESRSRSLIGVAKFENDSDAQTFFSEYFEIEKSECLCALFLNSQNEPICVEKICEGNSRLAETSCSAIARRAVRVGASDVFLAHNHPGGSDLNSEEDIAMTFRLHDLMSSLGINLREHYSVADGKARGIITSACTEIMDRFVYASPDTIKE